MTNGKTQYTQGNQNRSNNQGGNKQQRKDIAPLTSTLGNLEPNVVGFTIDATDLEKMAVEYMKASGFNVLNSVVIPKDTGRGDLIMRQYLFFDRNDNAIKGGGGDNRANSEINPALSRKLPTGGVSLSSELFRMIAPIALPDGKSRAIPAREGLVVIEIDPIAIVGLLLDVEPGIHRIVITRVEKVKKSLLIDVYKRLEANDFDPGANVDRFTRALQGLR